ncbi:MAG: hypothetical protein NTU57_02625 [Candidatus Aenigmarchaeota archaeon]|nr:hypothetical protein [Candidatus Aenigmarchaeota archaeon]
MAELDFLASINIWMWITFIVVAVFSVLFVIVIMYFILPMRSSPAKHFVKAKRENRPVFFLDAGKYFRCVVGKDKNNEGPADIYRSAKGRDYIKGGLGLKYCEGVLVGVAEDFRSLTTNIGVIDLMEMIVAKKWDPEEAKKKLDEISKHLKEDLGIKDEFMDLDEKNKAALKEVTEKFDALREKILKEHAVKAVEKTEEDHD